MPNKEDSYPTLGQRYNMALDLLDECFDLLTEIFQSYFDGGVDAQEEISNLLDKIEHFTVANLTAEGVEIKRDESL